MAVNLKAVAGTLGALLLALGVALVAPMGVALAYGEPGAGGFGAAAALALGVGGAAFLRYRPRDEDALRAREGFAVVALAWVLLSLVGALPFVFSGVLGYTDAFFETMSGLTTTGATILGGATTPDIEALPRAFLLWRSLAHWLGGMGIIVLTLAVLPLLGVGGMQMFKAEVSGPSADKLTPRVRETARRLWVIYIGLTVVQVGLLLPAMGWFDAVNHAFATMATGGFSTRNGSVADFQSAYVDWVITAFMFLAGISFALHYALLFGRTATAWRSEELRVYAGICLVATLVIAGALWVPSEAAVRYEAPAEAVRHAAFQAVAIVTSTGFGTSDYVGWPPLAVGVIFLLFFTGGMAGSTGGGIKTIRLVLLAKHARREVRRLLHPQAVLPLRLDHRVVPPEVMRNVLSFAMLYFVLVFAGTLGMTALGFDLLSAFGAAASCVGNIGPGFGVFGPVENYAAVPAVGKWMLAFLMLAGRLEVFTVLVLFTPDFWRR